MSIVMVSMECIKGVEWIFCFLSNAIYNDIAAINISLTKSS
jgi:hypothetical protein